MAVDPREKQAYMNASPAQQEVVRRYLCNLLALLRAQYFSYQTSHWQVVGTSYYGNHLLFMRLYESVEDQIDQLAEKLVGYLGVPSVDPGPQAAKMARYIDRWCVLSSHHKRGLQSEKDCQAAIKAAYDGIKAAQAMTLGLDDWLMATANAHEENEYLLQQALTSPPSKFASLVATRFKGATAPVPVAPSREQSFFESPRRREVSEFAETGAISNIPEVAAEASEDDQLDVSTETAVAEALISPPTPAEIAREPGGDAVSTLNRYVVESEDPEAEKAVVMNRERMASWLSQITGQ